LPATSTTTEVSVAAWASSPAIMTTGATATPTTIPTAVILPGTDVRQHQRPNKPRIVFAGPVPIDAGAGRLHVFIIDEYRTSVGIIANLASRGCGSPLSLDTRPTCLLKIEFRFLNGNLMVPGGRSAYLLVDEHATFSLLEVLMKRYLGFVAAAALLVGMIAFATDSLAAGHGGGGGGRFGGGHMGGGFRGPLLESVPSIPPPIFNPSTPYTVPAAPETPVSPASPGSVFGNG
jgi:hypothetical protein